MQSQVWRFADPAAAFKGFDDEEMQLQFQRRVDRLAPITQPSLENVTKDGRTWSLE